MYDEAIRGSLHYAILQWRTKGTFISNKLITLSNELLLSHNGQAQ